MTAPHDEPTPETGAWKLQVCGQGNAAYLAWPVSVWNEIEDLERDRDRLRARLAGVIEQAANVIRQSKSEDDCWNIYIDDLERSIRALAEPAEPVAQPERELIGKLEQHCEAMSAYSTGHSRDCHCAACAYRKWKLERTG